MSLYLGNDLISGNKPINLGVRNIGEVFPALLPVTDAGAHLLDGSLILGGGIYQGFIDYIADLYAENPSANYFCTEAQWQTSVTTYGSCGKFVYDSTNNTVRLPKVSDILQGTTDISALGDLVEAGLPNITGRQSFGTWRNNQFESAGLLKNSNGCIGTAKELPGGGNSTSGFDTNTNIRDTLHIDASRSSSLYKNNFNKVQPQTIKVLYYIVIANSTKTDIQVDIDEIATDLNGKADRDLSNLSTTGEKHFLNKSQVSNCILEAPNGTITYSGNTLTLKSGVKVLIPNGKNTNGTLKNIEVTVANDKTYTLNSYQAGRQRQPIFIDGNGNLQYNNISNYGYYVTDASTGGAYHANYSIKNNTMKITTGTAGSWQTVQYCYIGYMSIDSNLNITSVHIEQPLIINNALVESYVNGTSWYRVWSDGWCEQGGKIICAGDSGALQTINLLKGYVDTNYNIQTSYTNPTSIGSDFAIMITDITTSSFKTSSWAQGTWYNVYCSWTTCGYIN